MLLPSVRRCAYLFGSHFSGLEHLSPNQYIAALNGFSRIPHKWIANRRHWPTYTLFDDVESISNRGKRRRIQEQFRILSITKQSIYKHLKLDFIKDWEAGHLIPRRCELCGRLFLQQGLSHKYGDSRIRITRAFTVRSWLPDARRQRNSAGQSIDAGAFAAISVSTKTKPAAASRQRNRCDWAQRRKNFTTKREDKKFCTVL